jgi:thiol:disulfide interchange protein
LGMTAVLAAVGIFSGLLTVLPKPGPWMVWIKRLAAVVLILVAEYYLVEVGKTL